MISVNNPVIFNNRWNMVTDSKNKPTNGDVSVFSCVNLQHSIIDDVGGYVTDEFLQDYCCINEYLLGPYIQKLTKKTCFTKQYKN